MGGGGGWPAGLAGQSQSDMDYVTGLARLGQAAAPTPGPQPSESYGYLGGLFQSGIAAVPGLIGIGPERLPWVDAEALRRWEAEHPWSAAGASMASLLIPFTAGVRIGRAALEAVPLTQRLLSSVAANSPRALQAPITTPIIRESLALAPFEVARIGATAAVGDPGSLQNVAASAAMDFGLQALFSGIGPTYRSLRGRTEDEFMRGLIGPEYRGTAAPQEQLGQLYSYRAANPTQADEILARVDTRILQAERAVREQVPEGGERYVSTMWNGSDTRDVRRLFGQGATEFAHGAGAIRRQTLTVGEGGFQTEGAWRTVAQEAGLPEGFLADVQYPRVISGSTDIATMRIRNSLEKNLKPGRDGWRVERDANTGLFVMSKELPNGRFMLLKTANPNTLLGEDIFTNTMSRLEGYTRRVENPIRRGALERLHTNSPDSVYGLTSTMRNVYTPDLMAATEAAGSAEAGFRMMPGNLARAGKEVQETTSRAFQGAKHYIAPTNFEFSGKPGAETVRVLVQGIVDAARSKASVAMRGHTALAEGQSYLSSVIRPGPAGGFQGLIDSLKEADMPAIEQLLRKETNLAAARRELAGIDSLAADGGGGRANRALTGLEEITRSADVEWRDTQGLFGRPTQVPVQGHFGLSHMWRGEFRHTVVDDAGKPINVGSGRTLGEASRNALKLAEQYGGRPSEKGAFRTKSYLDDEQLAETVYGNIAKNNAPAAHREAAFSGGDNTKLTKQDLLDLVGARTQSRYNEIARTIVDNEVRHDILDQRTRYGDQVGDALQYRVDKQLGRKGEIDKWVNQKLEKLAPFLGGNAADKLVQGWNRLESATTLLTSAAYHVVNMLQPIQTTIPKLAYVMTANPGQLRSMLGFTPIIEGGQVRGFIGAIDPLLMAGRGVRALTNPDAEMRALIARAIDDGTLMPQLQHEFVGPGSHYGTGWRNAYKRSGTLGVIEHVLSWPAQKIDMMTRGHAFASAVELFRAMGVRDPQQLYMAAKQFTNRAGYQYTVADRPKVFNGPIGSAVGLYKNWALNNMFDWGTYASAAATRGQLAPLMWAAGGNAALAGVGSLPLVGVADYMSKMFTDKPLMSHIYSALSDGPNENNVADAVYWGLPTLLGITLQSQLSVPTADPVRDLNFLFSWSLLNRAHKVGTLIDHTVNSWRATGSPFSDPRTFDMLNYALGPRMLYKGLSEIQDGYAMNARTGRQFIGDFGAGSQIMNMLGFTPTRLAQAYEVSSLRYENLAARNAATQRLGAAFAAAAEQNDYQMMTFITQRAIATGADLGSVMRSASARIRRQHQPELPLDLRRDPQAAALFAQLGL